MNIEIDLCVSNKKPFIYMSGALTVENIRTSNLCLTMADGKVVKFPQAAGTAGQALTIASVSDNIVTLAFSD